MLTCEQLKEYILDESNAVKEYLELSDIMKHEGHTNESNILHRMALDELGHMSILAIISQSKGCGVSQVATERMIDLSKR